MFCFILTIFRGYESQTLVPFPYPKHDFENRPAKGSSPTWASIFLGFPEFNP